MDAKTTATALPFDNSYRRLPERFFAPTQPTPVEAPVLVKFNDALAAELGLDAEMLRQNGAEIFSGNHVPEGAEPVAMAYAGHQFGNFVPQLGDGRAILLGEVIDRRGQRRDIQLKGAGRTAFSRGGDGRAALGPVLREYIISEAMHALGIPATRALAAVVSGEPVIREQVLPGAIFTRVAASHVRVGTFQFFAARDDKDGIRTLADYVIDRHYPALKTSDAPYLDLLKAVSARQASLIARWLHVGFIHGVMNTDNMTISGESIDFGPCAFLDTYDPSKVFSSIDRRGRYAYASQPGIGRWNLSRLAETLLPLIDGDEDKAVETANAVMGDYPVLFQTAWVGGMLAKMGLTPSEEGDADFVQQLLSTMHEGRADYTLTFRALIDSVEGDDEKLRALFSNTGALDLWLANWRQRLARKGRETAEVQAAMRGANPAFIPRNHRIEQAITAAYRDGNLQPFETLLKVLSRPFDDQPEFADYMLPPQPEEEVLQTFCGT